MTNNALLMPLAGFVFGYAAILLTPGPNLFAIGGIAALRGLRASLPLCAGIASGASLLSVAICGVTEWGRAWPMLQHSARAVAALLLLYVAARLLLRQSPNHTDPRSMALSARDKMATFLAGVATAATNPITAAFFASQFLGALPDSAARVAALGLVPCLALLSGVTFGFLLSRPVAQRAAIIWHRPIRIASAGVIALAATIVALPLLQGAWDLGSHPIVYSELALPRGS